MRAVIGFVLGSLLALGCEDGSGDGVAAPERLPVEDLMDPATCLECHEVHHREWASSMHAYAAADPVFLAMNRKGQEETDGQLGDFCIGCHAPLAVELGLTTDGLNLDEVDDHLEGVNCYFCHNVQGIGEPHFNNPLELAMDQTMRGGLRAPDAVDPGVHAVAYSESYDGNRLESSTLCGACHDIVTEAGVELERTFSEWKASIVAIPGDENDSPQSCNSCHMSGRTDVVAEAEGLQVPSRRVHEHLFAGVDMALTPWPDMEAQRAAIACALATAVRPELCANPDGTFDLTLETNAGHGWPTGAAQDRRAWVELVAYDDDDNVVFESGAIEDDELVDKPADDPDYDPQLWVMRDWIYDENGEPTHDFWKAAKSAQKERGYDSTTLPVQATGGRGHAVMRTYFVSGSAQRVARVEVRIRIRAMGFDVLQELEEDGYLEPGYQDKIATHTLQHALMVWDRDEDGFAQCKTNTEPSELNCFAAAPPHRCILQPDFPGCAD